MYKSNRRKGLQTVATETDSNSKEQNQTDNYKMLKKLLQDAVETLNDNYKKISFTFSYMVKIVVCLLFRLIKLQEEFTY